MNVKNLNPLERHVEKIVLAVAAAGAVFIGYLAIQPITVPDAPTPIKPGEVEQQVSDAVDKLQDVRKQTLAKGNLTPRLENYVQEYQNLVQRQPLKEALVSASAVPIFAPFQEGIGPSTNDNNGGGDLHMQVVTPAVPAPKDVTAEAKRETVSLLPPPVPALKPRPRPPPGTPLPPDQTKDLNWVIISGRIPMADFVAEMNDAKLGSTEKLTQQDQRSVLYRIEVQRRARNDNGWAAWEPVAPTKANGDLINLDWPNINDNDLPGQVSALDSLFRKIAEPDFYTLATGAPFIPSIIAPPAATRPAAAASPPVAPAPGPIAPTGPTAAQIAAARGGGRLPVPTPPPVNDEEGTPAPAPAAPGMPDLTQLRTQPNIPFWFYDENVVPMQTYQYEVRIVMYNPTYRYPLGLKNPAMKNQPTIVSDWVVISAPVDISSDLYFFIDNNIGNNKVDDVNVKVGFRIYKWTNGNWYGTEGIAQPGTPVNGTVHLIDKANAPVDVATGYALVDVLPSSGGNDLNAVLLAPNGDLVLRGSKFDNAHVNKKRNDLEALAVKPLVVPVAPKPKPVIHLPGNTPRNDNPDQ